MHFAAEAGQLAATQSLLSRLGVDAGLPTLEGVTPLHMAVYGGHLDIVLLLLKREDVDIASVNDVIARFSIPAPKERQTTAP